MAGMSDERLSLRPVNSKVSSRLLFDCVVNTQPGTTDRGCIARPFCFRRSARREEIEAYPAPAAFRLGQSIRHIPPRPAGKRGRAAGMGTTEGAVQIGQNLRLLIGGLSWDADYFNLMSKCLKTFSLIFHVPLKPFSTTKASPGPTFTGFPPSGVIVIFPLIRWTNS